MNTPSHIYKKGKWWYNAKTGKYIHPDQLATVLEALKPKQVVSQPVDQRRWDLNY